MHSHPSLRILQKPQTGLFEKRLNRFAVEIMLEGQREKVYLPNSGRLEELLHPGATVMVEKRREQGKTLHDLVLIQTKGFPNRTPLWVGLDSRLPNQLLSWLVRDGHLSWFEGPLEIKTEPRFGHHRLDLQVSSPQREHILETKSVNLVDQSGLARFPDAPTSRGQAHLELLIQLAQRGKPSWLVFMVLREDAMGFSPFPERDPLFSLRLEEAIEQGVGVKVLKFRAGAQMTFLGEMAFRLPPPPFPGFWPPRG